MKATMILRTSGDPPSAASLRLRRLRLPALVVLVGVLLLTSFAGGSGAGIGDYQGTLYFAGPASAVTGSYQLTTVAPGAQGLAPVATAGLAGSGGIPTGNYKYVYVTSSGGALTASPASNQLNVPAPGNTPVTLTNVPLGADVYRAAIPNGTATGKYVLVSPPGGAAVVPYMDTNPAVTGSPLPQADNRFALGSTGWSAFVPGVSLGTSLANTMPVSATPPSIPGSCTGWTVDAAGGMTFPAGLWTFDAELRSDAAGGTPAAVLTAAMWKVDGSGNTIAGGTLVPPTDGGAIALDGSTQNVSVSYTTSSATTLATTEHLCVQFWRRQTTAYASPNGAPARTVAMLAWDPNTKISLHPAPNDFAAAALSSPADGFYTKTIPTLGATYSDGEADAGTLTIRLCTDSGCGTSPQDSGAMAATSGATLMWTPAGPLADGTYYWEAQAKDGLGLPSAWTSARSFVVDNVAPVTSIGPTMPPANTPSSSATFDLGSNEPGSTFECRLDGAGFAGCPTPTSYTGLANGTHTFDVRATDRAGNLDTSPASYTWRIDNVAPATPTLTAPSDGVLTTSLPQLRGTFNDASAGGDTGTVEFQICSASAAAGTSCAPVVQSATSGSVSNGGTGSVTPSALADGTYYWQARAQDVAGNQSSWSATRSFQLDATPPAVPALLTPSDGEWVRNIDLAATFSKPGFAGTGTVEFRLCSDALCNGVVRSGSSGALVTGASGDWSSSAPVGDGLWYWQARAHDSSGNVSAWSGSRALHLDTVAPGKPLNFNGVIGADGLTLRWSAPSDTIANYVVFVNGVPWMNLGDTEFEFKAGPFDAGDSRSFSVVAVDLAGNVGAMSPVLVGVPNLVGLTWPQALGATSARGLGLRRNAVLFSSIPMLVTSQDPPAASLAEKGSAVLVTMTPAKGARLAVRVKPGRVVCAGGSVLRLRVQLSASAVVGRRLLNARGRVVARGRVGHLRAGTSKIRVKLPRALHRGNAYRLMLDASGEGGSAHAGVRIKVGTRSCRAR